jgi:hypothetical protein
VGNSRWAQIGDMIIHKDRGSHEKCVGIVTHVGGHRKDGVFIEWSTRAPWNYNSEYGSAAVNIHNCFDEFEIVKA